MSRLLLIGQDMGGQKITSLGDPSSAQDAVTKSWVEGLVGASVSAFGRSLIDDADAAAGRSTLGLGSMSTQAASGVTITGGSITGITDLVVADGGTGVSTLTDHGVLLGGGTAAISPLALDASTTKYLKSGGASANPSWSTINVASEVTGTLPFGNGGTSATTAAGALAALSGVATGTFSFNTQAVTGITDLTMAGVLTGVTSLSLSSTFAAATAALGTKTASFNVVDIANATTFTLATSSALTANMIHVASAATLSSTLNTVNGIRFDGTVTTNAAQTVGIWNGVIDATTIRAGTGSASIFTGTPTSFTAQPGIQTQDTNAQTLSSYTGFQAGPSLGVFAGGSLTVSTLNAFAATAMTVPANATVTTMNGVRIAGPAVSASGTVTTYTGVQLAAPTAAGTLTTWRGIDIPAVTVAGTNVGIRNLSSTELGNAGQCTISTTGAIVTTSTLSATNVLDLSALASNAQNIVTATGGVLGARAYAAAMTLQLQRVQGNAGAGTPVTTGQTIGGISFSGATTSAAEPTMYLGAQIIANATQTYSATVAGTKLIFKTTPAGGQVLTTAFTVENDGSTTHVGDITLGNANIVLGTSAGTMIGTLSTQKLGFYGATPIVRGTAFTQTYATATHTHAAITAVNPPAGGTGATAGAYDTAANRNLMITSLTAAIADIANVKQVLNGLIDDLQSLGLIA